MVTTKAVLIPTLATKKLNSKERPKIENKTQYLKDDVATSGKIFRAKPSERPELIMIVAKRSVKI